MDPTKYGLNYLPFLEEFTETPTTRTRVSPRPLIMPQGRYQDKHQDCSLLDGNFKGSYQRYYQQRNRSGNYQGGGSSMYQQFPRYRKASTSMHQNSTLDDSYNNNNYQLQPLGQLQSPLIRLCRYYAEKIFSEKKIERMSAFISTIQENAAFRKMFQFTLIIFKIFFIISSIVFSAMSKVWSWSYILWKGRCVLHSGARILLWRMTLAKCDDVLFYGMILVLSPALFVVAIFGFLLSCFCAVRDSILNFKKYVSGIYYS
ncbi:uncharacterized protein LOC119673478 [Teleopsis dalmanni]|uniref:uncharacterized protein LOC119673478 n=1 Tax=Teleopsis dalmanni TaxID=139649 RepID=UPI0018CEF0C3|nr:uncharacterized protein LOC119673478 [Teleopsis dalmanni]